MSFDHFDAPARLAELLMTYSTMHPDDRSGDVGLVLTAEIRGIGMGASHLGGFGAMEGLDAGARRLGAPTSHLNALWGGIGGWAS